MSDRPMTKAERDFAKQQASLSRRLSRETNKLKAEENRFTQNQMNQRTIQEVGARLKAAKADNRKATASILTGAANVSQEVRTTTKWIWSGLTFAIIVFLVAGPGTAVIMQLVTGLGWYLWPAIILLLLIFWRNR